MWRRVLAGLASLSVAALIVLWPGEGPTRSAPPPPAPQPAPRVVAASPPREDAPEAAPPALLTGRVTIALERDGKPEIGPRLTLRDAQGAEESRPTDVLGLATFDLPLGTWLVMAPREVAGESIEVTAAPRQVRLIIPSARRVEGEVVDALGAPQAGILVTSEGGGVAHTDALGHFQFFTTELALFLSAATGHARATTLIQTPAKGVLLRLVPLTRLSLISHANRLTVTVRSPTRDTTHELAGQGELEVPVGEIDVFALAVMNGKLQRATHHLVARADQLNVLSLAFDSPPPISGLVHDARGAPLGGVTVGLQLAPSRGPSVPRVQETTVTDARGHFALRPALVRGGDPEYEVHLLAPWRERSPVLVHLGDAPVVIDAEPEVKP